MVHTPGGHWHPVRGPHPIYIYISIYIYYIYYIPGNSLWPFWDGEFTWPFSKVKRDLQRSGMKRSLWRPRKFQLLGVLEESTPNPWSVRWILLPPMRWSWKAWFLFVPEPFLPFFFKGTSKNPITISEYKMVLIWFICKNPITINQMVVNITYIDDEVPPFFFDFKLPRCWPKELVDPNQDVCWQKKAVAFPAMSCLGSWSKFGDFSTRHPTAFPGPGVQVGGCQNPEN